MKECKHPTCGDTCRREKKPKKVYKLKRNSKPIAKFSKKRQKVNVTYNKQARIFRLANPLCKINSPVCTVYTQGVHHLKGKATTELLLDERYWKPACNACNGYVEDNSEWAYSTGNKLLHNG